MVSREVEAELSRSSTELAGAMAVERKWRDIVTEIESTTAKQLDEKEMEILRQAKEQAQLEEQVETLNAEVEALKAQVSDREAACQVEVALARMKEAALTMCS